MEEDPRSVQRISENAGVNSEGMNGTGCLSLILCQLKHKMRPLNVNVLSVPPLEGEEVTFMGVTCTSVALNASCGGIWTTPRTERLL